MKIKAWKGGRSERIYARMTKEAKAKLLARVKHEGYKSLADWLKRKQWHSQHSVPDAGDRRNN